MAVEFLKRKPLGAVFAEGHIAPYAATGNSKEIRKYLTELVFINFQLVTTEMSFSYSICSKIQLELKAIVVIFRDSKRLLITIPGKQKARKKIFQTLSYFPTGNASWVLNAKRRTSK
jgi:hypothetical protein